MNGATLYGLGIGPGDPGLLTIKAREILARVPVIAYPAPEDGDSLVRRIADPHVPADRIEIAIATPMVADRFPAQDVYDRFARILAGHLGEGRDVAVLCEGDPFLYGSFMYLYQRLAGDHRCVVVPGVSSLAAVAAVAGRPLCERNEVLTVVPATLGEEDLEAFLASTDAAAIMKVGRHLGKVKQILARLGREGDAVYVARATFADQRVLPLAEMTEKSAPYFSMILVRGSRLASPAARAARRKPGFPSHLPSGAAIVALSGAGRDLARRLQSHLPNSRVHGLVGRTDGGDAPFVDTMAELRQLFVAGTPIVGIAAAGILIRAVAPLVADKHTEPPVVAVVEDGSFVVPLLGGHHGANRLARAIATATGGTAAITTAGDVRLGLALDDPPAGWRVANPDAAKPVARTLLAGEPVGLSVEAGDASWLRNSGASFVEPAVQRVVVTDRAATAPATLVLHPPVLAVGVGCERGAEPQELIELVMGTLAAGDLAPDAVACLASLDLKMDEHAVHAAAATLGVPVRFFDAAELEAEAPRLATPSEIVFREVGCHGVAEGAALAAAGNDAALIVPKRRSARATCAIARARGDIDPLIRGRARGSLTIVGIGPGRADWRTPEATRALAEASDIVGYKLYLDLIADLVAGKRLHAPPMTEEEARARLALDLAAAGNRVALVSSGDAGVYGLAALAFELFDRERKAAWQRIELRVAPGLSALLAAAARAGAPLGHDFCAISLSDLLTPWTEIERRLRAAAEGDFVVALYNPVSSRRRHQLAIARDILLRQRPGTTPVVLARNLGREQEHIRVIDLADLAADAVDMLTLVLVGSSRTRVIDRDRGRWVYTPRGYAAKLTPVDASQ
ncbi:MAG: precorrin-3B C(17)-methyltransferase [Rhodospirillales bacterium]